MNKIQKRWGIVAGVLIVLSILSISLQFGALYMLSKLPTPEAETNYISKSACQTIYRKLPAAVSNVNINDEEWISKIAEELTKNDENMSGYGLNHSKLITIHIFDNQTHTSEKAEFEVVKETPCSFSEANCFITAKTSEEGTACRFYFDDKGKVATSKRTDAFLKK